MTNPVAKRIYDLIFSTLGLLVLSPLLVVIALLVKLSDGGAILFRQKRVGQFGHPFMVWKFRTMVMNAEQSGLSVTKSGDARITPVGRFLRKTKLDELPQLLNVFRGEMSFVGPRPEVPRYVEQYTLEQRQILELKPGITDMATLEFRREEELLSGAADTERYYMEHCVPRKIELSLQYHRKSSLWLDTQVILRTLLPSQFQRR
jgi:lipopolysaccharide/colanic/teichoic acid biosynthesis glycosyltransferase